MNNAEINKLVNQDPNKIQSSVLQAALSELRERENKRKTEEAIGNLQEVNRIVDGAVNNLRVARQVEKQAKNLLVRVAAARDNFFKTGDMQKFSEEYRVAISGR